MGLHPRKASAGWQPHRTMRGGPWCQQCSMSLVIALHREGWCSLKDNSASLHSMVKGCAREPVLDRSVSLAHLLCTKHDIHMWFEFVGSESNWSDGISRG
eukprot:1259692-Amphidinium_carterae.1